MASYPDDGGSPTVSPTGDGGRTQPAQDAPRPQQRRPPAQGRGSPAPGGGSGWRRRHAPPPGQVDVDGLARFVNRVEPCYECGRFFYVSEVVFRVRALLEHFGGAATAAQLFVALGDRARKAEVLGEEGAAHRFQAEESEEKLTAFLESLESYGVVRRIRQRSNAASVFVLPDVFSRSAGTPPEEVVRWAAAMTRAQQGGRQSSDQRHGAKQVVPQDGGS
ncbi:hypothetical protein B9Q08_02410 [Candidatus Marsarchaeota G2 archaeon ECH_B_SAG-M15]|uniref:Uncharacterized protein n=1 Tax=Candidatus Marsarchaeota G2 archaeon ECH_B_SAG-M15 TaxID=1978162 RepID=A0A2R6AZA3_9ARCH|nr:MAG: hypothetical protein B9Q08_02410 [Candidatus Marsarchaeota G2 archaeon ECH_B_SAG-M15]